MGREVAVAFNRHECLLQHPTEPGEHCFSVREKPTSSSPVIGYADELWLEDVRFFASPGGLRRVQETGKRTPVAFVVGKVMKSRPAKLTKKRGWFKVRFEPFEHGCFFDTRNDACLQSAKFLRLGDRHMEAFGPERGKALGSLRELNPSQPRGRQPWMGPGAWQPEETIMPERETWRGKMGGLNYREATPEAVEAALEEVWRRWPGAIVVDGTDDWEAPIDMRPELWVDDLQARPLAAWDTGFSGESASGLIFAPHDWRRVQLRYREVYGFSMSFEDSPKTATECGCWDGEGFRVYPRHTRPLRGRGPQSGLRRRLLRY